jgi:hypothetical protein
MKEMMNLAFEISLFILQSDFLHARKSYAMGSMALLPLQRKMCCIFPLASKFIALDRFEPTNLASSSKHVTITSPR